VKAEKRYQGHKSRAAWSVSLALFNEESLYRLARYTVRRSETLDAAAKQLAEDLAGARTSEGYRYSKTNIRLALQNYDWTAS